MDKYVSEKSWLSTVLEAEVHFTATLFQNNASIPTQGTSMEGDFHLSSSETGFTGVSKYKKISHQRSSSIPYGRYLINNEYQVARRYTKFNIEQLCQLVSSAVTNGESRVCKIDKMEGGYHKALLMTLENGHEVVAKIPYPIAGPAKYSTASEVAIMQYIKTYPTIPVPTVLAWSSSSTNTIGSEYIIMEKAPGVQIFEVWNKMTELDKLNFISNLNGLEDQLAKIHFPGSLYLRDSIPEGSSSIPLGLQVDPTQSYCIGPIAGNSWYGELSDNSSHPDDIGPWKTVSEYGIAHLHKSLWRMSHAAYHTRSFKTPYHGDQQRHAQVIHEAIKLMPTVAQLDGIDSLAAPILWHTDFHMGNVYVSKDDNTAISSIIDWHDISIAPLFVQSRWPLFIMPPESYEKGIFPISLPGNHDTLDAEAQEEAETERAEKFLAKAY
ncbi:hypothetical protein FQN57_004331 [Myotisia sp. PD_48]|nr:hypothetical protein FQN57_004331 [Myotisia sp. PD_48]